MRVAPQNDCPFAQKTDCPSFVESSGSVSLSVCLRIPRIVLLLGQYETPLTHFPSLFLLNLNFTLTKAALPSLLPSSLLLCRPGQVAFSSLPFPGKREREGEAIGLVSKLHIPGGAASCVQTEFLLLVFTMSRCDP